MAKPKLLRKGDFDKMPPFPFHKVPRTIPGWTLQQELLCDASGFGQSWEPALTPQQLVSKLRELYEENPKYSYGIVDIGKFQLKLGVFLKGTEQ